MSREKDKEESDRTHWVNTGVEASKPKTGADFGDYLLGKISVEDALKTTPESGVEANNVEETLVQEPLLKAAEIYQTELTAQTRGFERTLDLIENNGQINLDYEQEKIFDQKLELYEAKELLAELTGEYAESKMLDNRYLEKTKAEIPELLRLIKPQEVENFLPDKFFKLKTQVTAFGNFEALGRSKKRLEAFLKSRDRKIGPGEVSPVINFSIVEAEEKVEASDKDALSAALLISVEAMLQPIEGSLEIKEFLGKSKTFEKLDYTVILEEGVKRILGESSSGPRSDNELKFAFSELEVLDKKRAVLAASLLSEYQQAVEKEEQTKIEAEFHQIPVIAVETPEARIEVTARVPEKPLVIREEERLEILEKELRTGFREKRRLRHVLARFSRFLGQKL